VRFRPDLSFVFHRSERIGAAHTFVSQLLPGAVGLGQMIETHTAEDIWRFGELNAAVVNDLDPIAPWIAEVKKRPLDRCDARGLEASRAVSLSSTTRPK